MFLLVPSLVEITQTPPPTAKPEPGCAFERLLELDNPPDLKVDSMAVMKAKRDQLQALEAFLERETHRLQGSLGSDEKSLKNGKEPLARILQIPEVATLRDLAKDQALQQAETDYTQTLNQIAETKRLEEKGKYTHGGPLRDGTAFGIGARMLWEDAHTKAWAALRQAFLEHATRTQQAVNSALKVSGSPLIPFLALRAELSDRVRLLEIVRRHHRWTDYAVHHPDEIPKP